MPEAVLTLVYIIKVIALFTGIWATVITTRKFAAINCPWEEVQIQIGITVTLWLLFAGTGALLEWADKAPIN